MRPSARSRAGPAAVSAAIAAGIAVGLAAFDPVVAVVTVILAAGVVAGALVAVNPTGLARLVVASVGAAAVAGVLALPFSIDLLAAGLPWHAMADGRTGAATTESLVDLLRFSPGPADPGMFVWALAVPMVVRF